MEFDKYRLLENINILIAEKKLKKNEVETRAGVSVGYLSRLAKPDNETIPSVDFVWRVAAELGVTMDALINYDYSLANDNLLLVSSFLQELAKETDSGEINWIKTDSEVFNCPGIIPSASIVRNPLFYKKEDGTKAYRSSFVENKELISETSFYAKLTTGESLYLMKLILMEGIITPFWELYINPTSSELIRNFIPICCTIGAGAKLEPVINDLVNCIERHEQDLKITNEARNVMNRFLDRKTSFRLPKEDSE